MTAKSSIPPAQSVAGNMWINSVTNQMHVFDGSQWIRVTGAHTFPETWEEWFDHYINSVDNFIPNSVKRGYVHEEMRGRFPGNYHVDIVNGAWTMVFDTPADETWWHLKYD